MLQARDLILRHGPREILRLDFHARPGRLTAIVGPNGAGKTTLLCALTGDAGGVLLNGQPLQALAPAQRARLRAVMAQQQPVAFPFRVADLLRMGQDAGDCAGGPDLAESALARHRAITQAVTGLAHELNTPLGVCVTAASHLQDLAGQGIEDVQEPAALLQSNLARAVDLVEAFTAIAACQHTGPLEALDAREVAEQAVALYAAQHPKTAPSVQIAPGPPCPWLGHAAHLERVLHHLLDNVRAHAYPADMTADATASITLAPALLDGKAAWRLILRDEGVGIAASHLPVLTDAFFTTARGRGHKGLGLAVVFNTVTGPMGGRLSIDSPPGGGTSVTLVIPQEV